MAWSASRACADMPILYYTPCPEPRTHCARALPSESRLQPEVGRCGFSPSPEHSVRAGCQARSSAFTRSGTRVATTDSVTPMVVWRGGLSYGARWQVRHGRRDTALAETHGPRDAPQPKRRRRPACRLGLCRRTPHGASVCQTWRGIAERKKVKGALYLRLYSHATVTGEGDSRCVTWSSEYLTETRKLR